MIVAMVIGGLFAALVVVVITSIIVDGVRDKRKAQLSAAQQTIDKLNSLAWSHREIYPELATIILDEIQKYEVKEISS